MKIVFDASGMAVRSYTKAGVYRYGMELLRHLPAHLEENEQLELFFNFFRQRHVARMRETIELVGGLAARCSRMHPRLVRALKVSVERRIGEHQVFHGPFDRLQHTRNSARVLTIHDLAFLRSPSGLPKSWIDELTATVPDSAKRAHRIITASEFSKSDIVEWLRIPAERVKVIQHGVAPNLKPSPDTLIDQKILSKLYGVQPNFILYLGTLQPNKNIENLCTAYQELRRDGWEGQLVLAGNEGWLFDEMWQRICDQGNDQGVVRTGFVAEEDISRLYGCCTCFALVSVLEGFGIPVVEAMACGAPVVVADSCSLPEVAGGLAEIVDPWNPRSIAEGLDRAINLGTDRADRTRRGIEHAKTFTWDKSAAAHMSVYREANAEVGN